MRFSSIVSSPKNYAYLDRFPARRVPTSPVLAAERAGVHAAGRRDRPRVLTIADSESGERTMTLPSLSASTMPDRPPVSTTRMPRGGGATLRFNNSLGEQATIAAFDEAMAALPPRTRVTLDLRDTPSGGNTSIARAVLGWFVARPTGYQMHAYPAEERETGIARQWIEQVLPRVGKHHALPVAVLVGRWTGSMGEGMAIGFATIGATVRGDRMAGLRDAVYDFTLPLSGLQVKLPAERVMTVGGLPREAFVPRPSRLRRLAR